MITVAQLCVYPVKSLQGIEVARVRLDIRGLQHDRQWMVADSAYRFVSQRELPAMAQIAVTLTEEALVLAHPAAGSLRIACEQFSRTMVEACIWADRCLVWDEGAAAQAWLTEVLGTWNGGSLRLLRFPPSTIRPVDPDYLRGEIAHTAFSDGFPFLVTSTASLQELNRRLVENCSQAVPMDRFRPNIVIDGVAAFAEDGIATLQAADGRYSLALRKPCKRCPTTTVDQRSGVIADVREPLRTLAQMKTQGDRPGAFFGQNAILLTGLGEGIAVGDVLEVRA